jgi:hypothetical protein
MALTSFGIAVSFELIRPSQRAPSLPRRAARMAPQVRFKITRIVAVKQCSNQSAMKVGRSEQPVRNRECQFMLVSIISLAL